jgi:hypothetical protein
MKALRNSELVPLLRARLKRAGFRTETDPPGMPWERYDGYWLVVPRPKSDNRLDRLIGLRFDEACGGILLTVYCDFVMFQPYGSHFDVD